ncbi:MAG: cob(I)yrinic acid a,c-diamide adenosyltransferase [Chloroflexia bacterium]|nr:cob(I)yrinic acid a,c-diamide adenosyltransferase [Chloroflexia bacterium]
MRLYTTKGDQGQTDLLGDRVAKDDPRIEALGSLDEATSSLGFARAVAGAERTAPLLVEVQRDLYKIMAELAFVPELRPATYVLGPDRVAWLEAETDQITSEITLPREFILPGDTVPGAALDVARTIVRRAERDVVGLTGGGHLDNPQLVRYLNRLSSLLFVLARFEDAAHGTDPLRAKAPRR